MAFFDSELGRPSKALVRPPRRPRPFQPFGGPMMNMDAGGTPGQPPRPNVATQFDQPAGRGAGLPQRGAAVAPMQQVGGAVPPRASFQQPTTPGAGTQGAIGAIQRSAAAAKGQPGGVSNVTGLPQPILRRNPVQPGSVMPSANFGMQQPGGRTPISDEDRLTAFGPGDNLMGSQITPLPTERLRDTRGLVDRARGMLADTRFSPFSRVNAPTGTQGAVDQEAIGQVRGSQLPGFRGIQPGQFTESDEALNLARGRDLPGFEGVDTADFASSAEAARARTLTAQGLESLVGAPSRQQLAQETFDRLAAESVPETEAAIRRLGQRAAGLGRLGSGMVTEDAGDIFGERKLRLANIRKELASETAGQELGDRLSRLQAARGVGGEFTGQDLQQAGFQQGLRGEERGEREAELSDAAQRAALGLERGRAVEDITGRRFGRQQALRDEDRGERAAELSDAFGRQELGLRRGQTLSDLSEREFGRGERVRGEQRGERATQRGFEESELGLRRAQLGDLAGLEQGQAGEERQVRDELRGERGFQTGRSDKALQDRIQQQLLEEQLLQGEFGRALQEGQFEQGIADTRFGQAGEDQAMIEQLLAQLAQQEARRRAGG